MSVHDPNTVIIYRFLNHNSEWEKMSHALKQLFRFSANPQIMFSMNDTYNGDDGVTKQDKQVNENTADFLCP